MSLSKVLKYGMLLMAVICLNGFVAAPLSSPVQEAIGQARTTPARNAHDALLLRALPSARSLEDFLALKRAAYHPSHREHILQVGSRMLNNSRDLASLAVESKNGENRDWILLMGAHKAGSMEDCLYLARFAGSPDNHDRIILYAAQRAETPQDFLVLNRKVRYPATLAGILRQAQTRGISLPN